MRNQAGTCDLSVNGDPQVLDDAILFPHLLALGHRLSLSPER